MKKQSPDSGPGFAIPSHIARQRLWRLHTAYFGAAMHCREVVCIQLLDHTTNARIVYTIHCTSAYRYNYNVLNHFWVV